MSLFNILQTSSSALAAQGTRLNNVADNLANVDTMSSSAEGAYRAKAPIFRAIMSNEAGQLSGQGVQVVGTYESDAPNNARYLPGHPQANDEGYVYASNVNAVEQMADMLAASRSYENAIETFNTAKQLALRTLRLGQN